MLRVSSLFIAGLLHMTKSGPESLVLFPWMMVPHSQRPPECQRLPQPPLSPKRLCSISLHIGWTIMVWLLSTNSPIYAHKVSNCLSFIACFVHRQTVIIVNGVIQRMCLSFLFYFLLSVAERTFKQVCLMVKRMLSSWTSRVSLYQ